MKTHRRISLTEMLVIAAIIAILIAIAVPSLLRSN